MIDELSQAVLSREEVVRYLKGAHGESPEAAQERVYAYLEELRTTQRYRLYRALQHPVYPILRKIPRHVEHIDRAIAATAAGRVIYASDHKSHTDYLIEPLVLDDHGVRPPIIAAGINLFGGPLGLLHQHVTGAVPIRRATKDPAYLITLKAYVAELLRDHDLLFYIEGGRSYTGDLKAPKTGLIHAAMQSDTENLVILPMAISYDLVLEDRILVAPGREEAAAAVRAARLAEMMRCAVGYRSRAFVTFGTPIATSEYDAQSKSDVLELAHRTRDAIGLLFKVTPTALVAAAMKPSIDAARPRGPDRRPARPAARARGEPGRRERPAGGGRGDRAVREARRAGRRAGPLPRPQPAGAALLRTHARPPVRAGPLGEAPGRTRGRTGLRAASAPPDLNHREHREHGGWPQSRESA